MLVLCGMSGTGKSSVLEEIKLYGFNNVEKYTTRKPRSNEKEVSDYIFVSDDFFEKLVEKGNVILKEKFTMADNNTVKYGYYKYDFIRETDNKCVIMTPDSLNELLKLDICKNLVIYNLKSSDSVIYDRLSKRGDDISEITRRIKADKNDFKKLPITNLSRSINTDEFTAKLTASYIVANYRKTLKEIENGN